MKYCNIFLLLVILVIGKEAYAMDLGSSRLDIGNIRRVEPHNGVDTQNIALDLLPHSAREASDQEKLILHGLDPDTQREIFLQVAALKDLAQPEEIRRSRLSDDTSGGATHSLSEVGLLARVLSSTLAEQKKHNNILQENGSRSDKIAIAVVLVAGFSFLTSLTGLILSQIEHV